MTKEKSRRASPAASSIPAARSARVRSESFIVAGRCRGGGFGHVLRLGHIGIFRRCGARFTRQNGVCGGSFCFGGFGHAGRGGIAVCGGICRRRAKAFFCLVGGAVKVGEDVGQGVLGGGDRHGELLEAGLARGEALHPQSRGGENLHDSLFAVLPGIHQKFIADAHNERQEQEPDAGINEGFPKAAAGQRLKINLEAPLEDTAHNEGQNDPEQDHHEHERGAAAGVETRAFLRVLGGQFPMALETGDRLVLGAVVLEGAADIRHERNQIYIKNEDKNFHDAGCDGFPHAEITPEQPFEPCGREVRQIDEEAERERDAEDQREPPDEIHEREAEVLFHPLIGFALFQFLARRRFGRVGQDGEGQLHRGDEVADPADQRDPHPFMFFFWGRVGAGEYPDIAVRQADGGRAVFARFHHHAVEDRFTADAVEPFVRHRGVFMCHRRFSCLISVFHISIS